MKKQNNNNKKYMPVVANSLKEMGWSQLQIEGAIDFAGVHQCLQLLRARDICVAVDGTVHSNVEVGTKSRNLIFYGVSHGNYLHLCHQRYKR